MGLFDKLFGRKKPAAPSTSEVARERLTLMLVHDRLKLTPELLGRIKEDLLAVISKYVEIDESGVDVELTHTENSDKLIARMPVKRQRLPFQRDVLEPGMGNPLAAAAALAKIHQPAGEAASAEHPASPAPAQPADSAPTAAASTAPATEAAPEAAQPSPAPEAVVPASPPGEAASQAAVEPAAPAATGPSESAGTGEQSTASASPEVPVPPGEVSAAPAAGTVATSAGEAGAESDAAPSAPAAGEAVPAEAPASAGTPTKG